MSIGFSNRLLQGSLFLRGKNDSLYPDRICFIGLSAVISRSHYNTHLLKDLLVWVFRF